MNFFIKPFTILFSFTLISGVVISLTSNNWMSMWMGLELNLYSFIPLVLSTKKNQEKEATVKYFLVQSLASMILLLSFLTAQNPAIIMITSMLMKLGMAPCHFWLPPVMNSLSWPMCWVLSTLQKIAPMLLLTSLLNHMGPIIISIISALSALTGGVGGLNQTQLRAILAYSSIGHMGWMSASIISSQTITLFYFISYILIISTTIKPLSLFSTFMLTSNKSAQLSTLNMMKLSLIPSLLSLAGLPPMFGFFPKLMIIYSLLPMNMPMLQIILIMSSSLNLYYYLKIMTITFFSTQKQNNNFYTSTQTVYLTFTILSTMSGILLMPLLL